MLYEYVFEEILLIYKLIESIQLVNTNQGQRRTDITWFLFESQKS